MFNLMTEFYDIINTIVKSRYKMLPYAGYVDPESTLAIGVHHDGHLEATERTFCSLYHTFMFGFHPFAGVPSRSATSFFEFFIRIIIRRRIVILHCKDVRTI